MNKRSLVEQPQQALLHLDLKSVQYALLQPSLYSSLLNNIKHTGELHCYYPYYHLIGPNR